MTNNPTSRILIVNDRPSDGNLMSLVLRGTFADCTVDVVVDALGFYEYVLAGPPLIAIVDQRLHFSDGLEVLRFIRRRNPDCLLVLTAEAAYECPGAIAAELRLAATLTCTSAGFLQLPATVQAAIDAHATKQSNSDTHPWIAFEADIPLGLFALSDSGAVVRANTAVARILGLPIWTDLIGKPIQSLLPEELPADLQAARTSEFATVVEQRFNVSIGGQAAHATRLRMWRTPTGHDAGWLGLLEELPAASGSAAIPADGGVDAHAAKDCAQLVYAVSHDLQEPLQIVSRHARLLAEHSKTRLDPDDYRLLGNLQTSAAQMQTMLDAILEYSRIGGSRSRPAAVNLEAVIDEALSVLRISLDDAGAVIQRSSMPSVRGVYRQFVQLFQNLIANALKYRSQRPLQIALDVHDAGTEWTFTVKDNGIGIADADQERIFELFRRLHTQEEYPGSGIGLALCRRIVESHGGRIWVQSSLGQGTTVLFVLPKSQPAGERGIAASRRSKANE